MHRIKVWDPLVGVFHWSLVIGHWSLVIGVGLLAQMRW
ncbi:hypothetical protein DFP92_103212 [Yoonia sediminilitoris]|uniref:Uncharacterized protein n=1 Tax=Yoonia sediminilitoris TaxID=1286148 RepID=A0A2T6KK60_9RHOB|nr:hypothetical protein C8N45_103212 [Yoonia sediminilitoris]RCW96706.1 hypothetical protein DFP92_103212 [Yoonia sediminilitoris]